MFTLKALYNPRKQTSSIIMFLFNSVNVFIDPLTKKSSFQVKLSFSFRNSQSKSVHIKK